MFYGRATLFGRTGGKQCKHLLCFVSPSQVSSLTYIPGIQLHLGAWMYEAFCVSLFVKFELRSYEDNP
jgi:hypothetical protein